MCERADVQQIVTVPIVVRSEYVAAVAGYDAGGGADDDLAAVVVAVAVVAVVADPQ